MPHRPPFLFVDEILEIVPGESARGIWRLTGDEAFFAGTAIRSNFLVNLGKGDTGSIFARSPRLGFDEACLIA